MKNILVFAASLLVSLVLAEVLLRAFTPFPINVTSNRVDDDELAYITDPGFPGIDRWGFRNTDGPEGKSVFAIGDSHTFGYGVKEDQAWPVLLSRLTGLGIYNMSAPSYNVYQYFRLAERALHYHPQYIIMEIYAANDLAIGACRILMLDYWKRRALELGLRTDHCSDSGQSREMAELLRREQEAESAYSRLKRFVKSNFALVGAFDKLIWDRAQQLFRVPAGGGDPSGPADGGDPNLFTISPSHPGLNFVKSWTAREGRLVDLGDRTIRGHLENSRILFRRIKALADQSGVKLVVLSIPSKKRVVTRWAAAQGKGVPALLRKVAADESEINRRFMEMFAELSIPAVDATDRLVAAVDANIEKGIATYQPLEQHPTAAGQLEYAKAVLPFLLGNGAAPQAWRRGRERDRAATTAP